MTQNYMKSLILTTAIAVCSVLGAAEPLLTKGDREELLSHWSGADRAQLKALLLRDDLAGFDQALLDDMRSRTAPRFFFDEEQLARRLAFIKENMPADYAATLVRADSAVKHLLPFDDSSPANEKYTKAFPEVLPWIAPEKTWDTETLHALNRHRFWVELALAYRLTGDERYAAEVSQQLKSWCAVQGPAPRDGVTSDYNSYRWALLDTAIRGDTWVWTYFLLYRTLAWTPEINTLFLYYLWMHGRSLAWQTPAAGSLSNWTVMQAQGLLNIAVLFPEFTESNQWNLLAQNSLTGCLNRQFRADGGHCEESPEYFIGCITWFIEPLSLAVLNGDKEAANNIEKLRVPGEAFFQMLHPDGTIPLLSDSDLDKSGGYLTTACLALNEPRWRGIDHNSIRNVLLWGPPPKEAATGVQRPDAFALKDSGYYMMRTTSAAADAVQLTFDCGPKGGLHGHFDLLSFELYGYGRPLLCDPGRWTYSADKGREWIVGTSAHNTINVDGLNHDPMETAGPSSFEVKDWQAGDDFILVKAGHRGYAALPGSPDVGRSIWFDRKDTFIILSWGAAQAVYEYNVVYNFPGNDAAALTPEIIASNQANGNVRVCNLPLPGQTTLLKDVFWSPVYGKKEPAIQFTVSENGKDAVFCQVVTVYQGKEPPDVSAEWLEPPVLGKTARIKYKRGALERIVALDTGP